MGHIEGNFTPVLYMGRKVPKGYCRHVKRQRRIYRAGADRGSYFKPPGVLSEPVVSLCFQPFTWDHKHIHCSSVVFLLEHRTIKFIN